jgi:hypothetical protein
MKREGETKGRSNEQGLEGGEVEEDLGEGASEGVGIKVAVEREGGEDHHQCQI